MFLTVYAYSYFNFFANGRKALKALALGWGKSADCCAWLLDHLHGAVFQLPRDAGAKRRVYVCALSYLTCWRAEDVVCHSLHLSSCFQRVCMISLNAYAIRAAQWIGAQCAGLNSENSVLAGLIQRVHRRVGGNAKAVLILPASGVLNCENGVFWAMVSAQGVSDMVIDAWILRAVHHQQAAFRILLCGAAGCFAVGLKRTGDDECLGFCVHPSSPGWALSAVATSVCWQFAPPPNATGINVSESSRWLLCT